MGRSMWTSAPARERSLAAARSMFYSIDGSRLLVLLVLLGAGMFVAVRLLGPASPGGERTATLPRRVALRGMVFMTSLGLLSGVAGGLLEGEVGASALVGVLHTIYSVCWLPAFAMAQLQKAFAAPSAASRLLMDLLGQLGLLLIPVLWFLVFFCAALLLGRPRRAR